jgi:hypothetical protein
MFAERSLTGRWIARPHGEAGEHCRSKPSVLLAGNARAAERLIRASETLAADDKQEPRSPFTRAVARCLVSFRGISRRRGRRGCRSAIGLRERRSRRRARARSACCTSRRELTAGPARRPAPEKSWAERAPRRLFPFALTRSRTHHAASYRAPNRAFGRDAGQQRASRSQNNVVERCRCVSHSRARPRGERRWALGTFPCAGLAHRET